MKSIFNVLLTTLVLMFISWLWTLIWNYGIVVLLANYSIATLEFIPAVATSALFGLAGFALGVVISAYVLNDAGMLKKK